MMASELVRRLNEAVAEHGDREVTLGMWPNELWSVDPDESITPGAIDGTPTLNIEPGEQQ